MAESIAGRLALEQRMELAGYPPPTARQLEYLATIEAFQRLEGFAPTRRELGHLMGVASTKAVQDTLEALQRKRLVAWAAGKARSLVLTAWAQAWLERHPEAVQAARESMAWEANRKAAHAAGGETP